jgi:hypothetical protein
MSVEKATRAGGEVVWRTFSTRRDARDFDAEVRR